MDGHNAHIASYINQAQAPQWLAGMTEVPQVAQYKETSYELMQLRPGMTVLDLGCGVGDDARRLLDRVKPGGSVIGVDAEAEMIAQAQARHVELLTNSVSGQEGSLTEASLADDGLQFLVAPAERIPLPDQSCDAVRADRLLQHVSDPLIVLGEVERVLRPGGMVVLVEPDWRSMAIHPGSPNGDDDDHVLQAVLEWQIGHTRHPLMGRQLRARLNQAGFTEVKALPVAYSTTSFAIIGYALELEAAGEAATREDPPLISRADLDSWFAAAQRAETAGDFYSEVTLFFGLARKPA